MVVLSWTIANHPYSESVYELTNSYMLCRLSPTRSMPGHVDHEKCTKMLVDPRNRGMWTSQNAWCVDRVRVHLRASLCVGLGLLWTWIYCRLGSRHSSTTSTLSRCPAST